MDKGEIASAMLSGALQNIIDEENPTSINSLDANWERFRALTANTITSHDIKHAYLRMIDDLREDRRLDHTCTLLGLYRAPGSKERHHAVEGGLIIHLLEMFEIWKDLREIIRRRVLHMHIHLDDQSIWLAILHHDLNKIWKYQLISEAPWMVDYGNQRDRIEYMLGGTNKSLWLLAKYGIRLSLPLHNALICAEGGFSETPRPHTETVLAKVAYILDEMSANVVNRLQHGRFWDSKVGGLSETNGS